MFEFSQRRQNLQEESLLGSVGEPAPISEWAAEGMVSYETAPNANCGLLGLSSVSDHRKENKNETSWEYGHAAKIGQSKEDIDYGGRVNLLNMKHYRLSRKRKKKIWRKGHRRKPSFLEQKGSAHPKLRQSQVKVNSLDDKNFNVSLGVAKRRVISSECAGFSDPSWKDRKAALKGNLALPKGRWTDGDAKRNAERRGFSGSYSSDDSVQYDGFLMTLENSLEDINAKERKLTEEIEKLRRIKKAQQERTRKQVKRNSSKRKSQSFDVLGKDEEEDLDTKEKQGQSSEEGRNYRARMSIVSELISTHSVKASQQSRSNQFDVLSEENEREQQHKSRQSMVSKTSLTNSVKVEKQKRGGQLETTRAEAKGKPRRERVSFVSMNETGEDEIEEPMTGFDQDEEEDPLFLQEVIGTTQRNTYIKDWKDNWIFPEGLDPAKEGRTNLRRFEYKCKPLAEILQRCQIFNKPTHERWTHLKYAFYMVRNMAALEYRIMRNDTEGVLIPNYVLDALSSNLQTVIGGIIGNIAELCTGRLVVKTHRPFMGDRSMKTTRWWGRLHQK